MDVTNINTHEERMIIVGENEGMNSKLIEIVQILNILLTQTFREF